MAMMQFVVVFFSVVICLHAADLPSYLKPCSMSDPNLNQCAVKNGQAAISSIVKGDKNFKIPSMTPLDIPEIKFSSGGLDVKLTNAKVSGFEDTIIKNIKIDLKKQHLEIEVALDRANLLAHYNLDGQILVLPIKGDGEANLTFVGGLYHYQCDYQLKDVNGEKYVSIAKGDLDYSTKRAYFHFDNLFNGDKALGEQTNNFLNENYKDVEKDLGPAISETINSIIKATVKGVFDAVPFSKLFLP